MYLILIIYFILNSLYFALNTLDSYVSISYRLRQWVVLTLFGLPIMIYHSLPTWHWFQDNVIFWFYLWFTDRYNDYEMYKTLMRYDHMKDKKQTKAIAKKYGFK